MSNKFSSTSTYIATEELQMAVNAAVTLERPLLIKGEPGTGKTMLAEEVAASLDLELISWHIKSTTKAQQGLYEYDADAKTLGLLKSLPTRFDSSTLVVEQFFANSNGFLVRALAVDLEEL